MSAPGVDGVRVNGVRVDGVKIASGPWRPAGTAVALAVGAGGLTLLGLVTGRADVIVMASPLLIALVWNWVSRPTGRGTVMLTLPRRGADGRIAANIVIDPATGSASALLRVAAPEHRSADVLVASHRQRKVRVSVSGVRTGRRSVFAVAHQEASNGRFVRSDPRTVGPVRMTVLPRAQPLGRLPLPPRLQGMTGSHGSRRVGEGGDLHDVALFAPGARLRRIDWRVTLREAARSQAANTGTRPGAIVDLYVRRTLATADAVVTLVLDSRDEVGPDPETWSGAGTLHPDDPTSLDIARHIAASIAARYLEAGDRVGLVDLAGWRPPIRPAGGRRHLHRLTLALAEAMPAGDARPISRPPPIPSGALVVVLSTFLDDEAGNVAAQWVRHGHRLIALDILPPVEVGHLDLAAHNAYRIVEIERQNRIGQLARAGVEVVTWRPKVDDMTSLAAGLAAVAVTRPRRR